MSKHSHITEIIPDDMPEWMIESMAKGTLFKDVIDRMKAKTTGNGFIWEDPSMDTFEAIREIQDFLDARFG